VQSKKTIQFDRVVITGDPVHGEASLVSEQVPVSVDDESVQFTLPSGENWACDRGELASVIDDAKSVAGEVVAAGLARPGRSSS